MVEKYVFSPKRGIVVTPYTARVTLGLTRGDVPVDFGLRQVEVMRDAGGGVVFLLEEGDRIVDARLLEKIVETDRLLFIPDLGEPYLVEIRDKHYYKLRYLGERTPPTVEIDGIHMHNISGTTPDRDAKRKVDMLAVRRGEKGLDICTGLGYTATEAYRRGASIITIEADLNVLRIAEHNPFSRELSRVEILLGDALQVIDVFPEEGFDFILHDPPVFAFAPKLYSTEFYVKLARILKKRGRLFHYTGSPGKHRGLDIQRGVAERLRKAGFVVKRVEKGYGLLAVRV
ncbi:MAG: MnmC family methyltransferase [Infirmifilum sp.]